VRAKRFIVMGRAPVSIALGARELRQAAEMTEQEGHGSARPGLVYSATIDRLLREFYRLPI
jgi:hypothetical protein